MHTLRIAGLLLSLTAALWSAPVLTLDPADGAISGTQGSVIGWGFSLTPDPTFWTVITAVQMDVSAIGTFEDYLSVWFSVNSLALAPGGPAFVQSFVAGTPGTATGVAAVTLNTNAPLGLLAGVMDISYDLYDADPFLGGNLQQTGQSFTPSFGITVNQDAGQPAPEPATLGLALAAIAAMLVVNRRR